MAALFVGSLLSFRIKVSVVMTMFPIADNLVTDRSSNMNYFPMCGFIAQLVEHRSGIAEVTGSNPVEGLIFSGFFFPIA